MAKVSKSSKILGWALMLSIGAGSFYLSWHVHDIAQFIENNPACQLALAAGLGLLGLSLFSKRMRRIYKAGFCWVRDKIAQTFGQERNPLDLLREYVASLERNFRDLSENISKLRAQIARIKDIIKQNNHEISRSTRLIDEAKRQERHEVVAVNYNQIGRLNKLNEKYALMVGRMENLNDVLIKMHQYSSFKLNDTKNEIRMKEQEFAAISSGYSAMENAKTILSGNSGYDEMYAKAAEALCDDLHAKIAEMDNFMQLSSSLFDEMDLQKAIYQLEGENMYEKVMSEGQAILDKVDYKAMTQSYLPNQEK